VIVGGARLVEGIEDVVDRAVDPQPDLPAPEAYADQTARAGILVFRGAVVGLEAVPAPAVVDRAQAEDEAEVAAQVGVVGEPAVERHLGDVDAAAGGIGGVVEDVAFDPDLVGDHVAKATAEADAVVEVEGVGIERETGTDPDLELSLRLGVRGRGDPEGEHRDKDCTLAKHRSDS